MAKKKSIRGKVAVKKAKRSTQTQTKAKKVKKVQAKKVKKKAKTVKTKTKRTTSSSATAVPARKGTLVVKAVGKRNTTAGSVATRSSILKVVKRTESKKPRPIEPVISQPYTVQQLRKVKTGLTKRDIQRFREQLLTRRTEILGDVQSMQTDARAKNAGGNLSHMPVHMADVGSDNYEQEFTLGLVESERRLIGEIDQALERMVDGIYGVCLERGVPISRARLEAKPWAKYCIEVARERERRGGRA